MKDFDIWDVEWKAVKFSPLPLQDGFLNERYDWQKNENGAEWPYYRFFYHLSQILQPQLVVELGGYQGTAAAHFAAGCPESKVITIDHHTDPGDEINKEKMEEVATRYPNVQYIQGWTNPGLAQREKGNHALGDAPDALPIVIKAGKIDILFIDSWHNLTEALVDWETYKPLLNSPSLVICDDIQDGMGPAISGMLDFWQVMPDPKFLNANLHPATQMGFFKYEGVITF